MVVEVILIVVFYDNKVDVGRPYRILGLINLSERIREIDIIRVMTLLLGYLLRYRIPILVDKLTYHLVRRVFWYVDLVKL